MTTQSNTESGDAGFYTAGGYASRHPTWHVEDSAWKAAQIVKMLRRHDLRPRKVCEVGCGAGEILRQLRGPLGDDARLVGYEISPQAYELAVERSGPGLEFKLADFLAAPEPDVDLLLLIDVIEHVEDHLGFLRRVRPHAQHTILHIPLDLSVEWVLRGEPLVEEWRTMGHLHSFTKGLAFEALEAAGFQVVDSLYTPWGLDLHYPSWRAVWAAESRVKGTLRKLLLHGVSAID